MEMKNARALSRFLSVLYNLVSTQKIDTAYLHTKHHINTVWTPISAPYPRHPSVAIVPTTHRHPPPRNTMAFAGKWTFVRGENVKEFMLAAGAPAERAENAEKAQTTVECSKDGDYYVINITGPKGNTVTQRFKPGEPFTESFAALGKERQAVATIEGNKVVISGVQPGQVVETREVNGDEMTFTLTKEGVGVIAKRIFTRA